MWLMVPALEEDDEEIERNNEPTDNRKPTDRQLAVTPSAPPLGAVGSPRQPGRAAQTPLIRPGWRGLPPAPMPMRPPPKGAGSQI